MYLPCFLWLESEEQSVLGGPMLKVEESHRWRKPGFLNHCLVVMTTISSFIMDEPLYNLALFVTRPNTTLIWIHLLQMRTWAHVTQARGRWGWLNRNVFIAWWQFSPHPTSAMNSLRLLTALNDFQQIPGFCTHDTLPCMILSFLSLSLVSLTW